MKCKIHDIEKIKVKDSSIKSGERYRCIQCKKEYADKYKPIANKSRRNKYDSEKEKRYYSERAKKDIVKWRAESIRHLMQKRKDDFDSEYFTVDNIKKEILDKYCPICNKKFEYESGFVNNKNDRIPSADRLDSEKGYTKDNVRFICWRCNRIKRSSTIQELEIVVNFLKKRLNKLPYLSHENFTT